LARYLFRGAASVPASWHGSCFTAAGFVPDFLARDLLRVACSVPRAFGRFFFVKNSFISKIYWLLQVFFPWSESGPLLSVGTAPCVGPVRP